MSTSKQISPTPAETRAVSAFQPSALADLARRASAHLTDVQDFEVTSAEEQQLLAQGLVEIATTRKAIDDNRKAWVAPLNAEKDIIQKAHNALLEMCDAARAVLDKAGGAYALKQAHEQKRQVELVMQAVVAGDNKALTVALNARAEAAPLATKGVTFKAFWRAEVFAPELVPLEFLAPDVRKIGEHASRTPAGQEPAPIGGVRFTLETGSTVRTGRQ